MRIDSRQYGGRCICGKEHQMSTRTCIIDSGVLRNLDEILKDEGIQGKRCAVYGSNTWNNPLFPHPHAEQEIVLPSEGLHADEHSTAELCRAERDSLRGAPDGCQCGRLLLVRRGHDLARL